MSKNKDTIFDHPEWAPVDSDGQAVEPGTLGMLGNGVPPQWVGRAMAPAAPGYSGPLTLKDHMQYELLNAADIAFILKHRPGSMPPGQYLNHSTAGGVGMGVDRMQKLCSFEWLQLYVYYKFMRDSNVVVSSGSHTTPYLVGGGRPSASTFSPIADTSGLANALPGIPKNDADSSAYNGKKLDPAAPGDYWAIGGTRIPAGPFFRSGTLVGVYHPATVQPVGLTRVEMNNAGVEVGTLYVNGMIFQDWISANFQPPVQRFLTTGVGGNYGGAPFFSESALMLGEDDWFAANDLIHRIIWHHVMLSDSRVDDITAGGYFDATAVTIINNARRGVTTVDNEYNVVGGPTTQAPLELMGGVENDAGFVAGGQFGIASSDGVTKAVVVTEADGATALFNLLGGSFSSLCATVDPVALSCFPSPLFATSGWSYVEDHRLEEQLERAGLFDWCALQNSNARTCHECHATRAHAHAWMDVQSLLTHHITQPFDCTIFNFACAGRCASSAPHTTPRAFVA